MLLFLDIYKLLLEQGKKLIEQNLFELFRFAIFVGKIDWVGCMQVYKVE